MSNVKIIDKKSEKNKKKRKRIFIISPSFIHNKYEIFISRF